MYRKLTSEEITQLEKQGCHCEEWNKVQVTDNFNPSRVYSTTFSGTIKLGCFDQSITFFGGIQKPTGISNATLHNCIIGDNVYINNVKNYIANYQIGDNVIIENVDVIATEGECTFGNGTKINVIDESGGRAIHIYDQLSAHTAYIMALYRHRPTLIQNIEKIIAKYTASATSSMGVIGKGVKIINSHTIKNVKIGPSATIEGTERLFNGSINSCIEAPVYIGSAVIAEDFIASSGSSIDSGSMVSHCFIGQSTKIAKQFSAEHSVFFANCAGYHGEACSIFAGPFTVTHHKATLLIAGLYSFLNAGSGSNQSNHMYKLGPIHQGIVERGSKTSSDSYILWPAKIGAFTVVMGRHIKNSDTSDLPFSYLIENNNESILVPAANLRSVGTIRDARKWPKRDKRKDPNILDQINFNLLSPFTIQKMINGYRLLNKLKEIGGETSEFYSYNNVKIYKSSLEKGLKLYEIGIYKFLGNSLINRLKDGAFTTNEELRERLQPDTSIGNCKWLDLAGLIAPEQVIDKLISGIEEGVISTQEQINLAFQDIHKAYYTYEWTWVVNTFNDFFNKDINKFTLDDVIEFVEKWKESVIGLDKMLYEDAKKEFTLKTKTGYGVDGEEKTKQQDFEQVRGEFSKNPSVIDIQEHIKEKSALGDELINRIKKSLNKSVLCVE